MFLVTLSYTCNCKNERWEIRVKIGIEENIYRRNVSMKKYGMSWDYVVRGRDLVSQRKFP